MSSLPQLDAPALHAALDSGQLAVIHGDLIAEWTAWLMHCGAGRETAKAIVRQAVVSTQRRHPRIPARNLRPYIHRAISHAWTEFKRRQGSTLHQLAAAEVQRHA